VLYEMIEARPPFELDGLTLAETISTIVSAKPMPLSRAIDEGGAGPALSRVIMKALSKKPASRQRSMKAFVAALHRALASDATR